MAQVATIEAEPADYEFQTHLRRRGAVLVVEDRKDMRDGLVQLLLLNGYPAVGASTAGEALCHLEVAQQNVALILLDLMLPGPLSGVDFRDRQLADAALASIPAVVISACESSDSLAERLQPAEWLEKPFRGNQLLAVVERFVESD